MLLTGHPSSRRFIIGPDQGLTCPFRVHLVVLNWINAGSTPLGSHFPIFVTFLSTFDPSGVGTSKRYFGCQSQIIEIEFRIGIYSNFYGQLVGALCRIDEGSTPLGSHFPIFVTFLSTFDHSVVATGRRVRILLSAR